MNLQSILQPIADFVVWTFDTVLVPVGDASFNPNSLFIIGGFVGLFVWLKMQGDFNRKAEQEGGLK